MYLLRRLAGYPQIIWRSIGKDVPLTIFLLYMNWLFRKEYVELKKRRAKITTGVYADPDQ
jgi:hypothetical protein